MLYPPVPSDCLRGVHLERFERRIIPEPNTGCFLWIGSVNSHGYGQVFDGQKIIAAHRASYALAFGSIPAGTHVLHRCDVPCCVNPDHLFLGDHVANMLDMGRKGRRRDVRGERHHGAKLTADQVKYIRDQPQGGRPLAKEFGISYSHLKLLRKGRCWK